MITALGSRETRGNAQVSEIRSAPACQLVGKTTKTERSTVWVSGVPVGPGTVTVIAGPCAVESPDQTVRATRMAQAAGASLLRGGAFKPRTSPYAFQGLGEDGLKILAEARAETGLPVVTEVLDAGDIDLVASYADMLQIGARNAQNYALLRAVGRSGCPVLLKRGMGSTVEEWLLAAEYIAQQGNSDIVLCERGIRTFETATRSTLDIAAVPLAQRQSHLPVIVDPSHSCGRRELVIPLTRAAIAAGADGIMIDVHPDPYGALCDGRQALVTEDLLELAESVTRLAAATGRAVTRPPGTQVATALGSA
jgi:3-deoxy-7-phosphoheptulonate synthase